MRKTRIVCTIGPASNSLAMLEALANAGMNVARLNFSHGDHQSHSAVIQNIKQLNQSRKQPIAILIDTQGPEIRTGDHEGEWVLQEGEHICLVIDKPSSMSEKRLHVAYPDLLSSLEQGSLVTLDNGLINLKVLEKRADALDCLVIDCGVLTSRRHVNLPNIHINLPAITAKDHADIQFAITHDVDFIALSFVRRAEDIEALRDLLQKQQSKIRIIAKIEDHEGVANYQAIVRAADAVMVARGDLGVEVAIENLPNIQRDIVKYCALQGKPVIVATHLLESMIHSPIPTRAEVSDIANAVYEQADAIMLSGETSMGKYPLKCVEYFDRIASSSEQLPSLQFAQQRQIKATRELLANSAVRLADQANAKGILIITKYGLMASYAAMAKPENADIFAFTFNPKVQQQLSLFRAVNAYLLEPSDDGEAVVQQAFSLLKQMGLVTSGERMVVLSDFLLAAHIDVIQLRNVP